jgi:positive regulator of sigma E activity
MWVSTGTPKLLIRSAIMAGGIPLSFLIIRTLSWGVYYLGYSILMVFLSFLLSALPFFSVLINSRVLKKRLEREGGMYGE